MLEKYNAFCIKSESHPFLLFVFLLSLILVASYSMGYVGGKLICYLTL